jgi:general secretion pathway protein H
MTRERHATAGYTLVELLVIVALISVVVAVAVPASLAAVDGSRINADARSLVSKTRELQAAARNKLRRGVLTTTPEGALLIEDRALELPNGSSAGMVGPNKSIVFYENGTTSEGRIRLSLGDRRVDVAVGWLTGNTTIEAVP